MHSSDTSSLCNWLSTACFVVILLITLVSSASARKSGQVLYVFHGNQDISPTGTVVFDSAGNIYGTSAGFCFMGPPCGAIWELTPTSSGLWKETVLHEFGGEDGSSPTAGLTPDSVGNLYGTASIGGDGECQQPNSVGCGTVYELTPTGEGGWLFNLIYVFEGYIGNAPGGHEPATGVILDSAGNVYGTTHFGGHLDWGVVFKLSPNPEGGFWNETILYTFLGYPDGAYPNGLVFDSAGNLYGTTSRGGNGPKNCFGDGCGVIFKLSPTSIGEWKETILYNFTGGADGGYPEAGLIFDSAGSLYGTTQYGGAYEKGTVFKLDSNGRETVLHSFNGDDGAYPYASLLFDPLGNLYGTTLNGGIGECQFNCGVVFRLTPTSDGWKEQFFQFNGSNGALPYGGVVFDSAHNVFGITSGGGHHLGEGGEVYEIFRPTGGR